MKYKYVLNEKTSTLHQTDKCHWARFKGELIDGYRGFKTEDEAFAYGQLHIRKCKLCFKNQ